MTDTSPCAREITWSGGTHVFDLGHPWVRRVMSYRGPAPAALAARFETSTYTPDDVERVIQLGLLGGHVPERDVDALLDAHVRGKPLGPNVILATAVLAALFVGADNADA